MLVTFPLKKTMLVTFLTKLLQFLVLIWSFVNYAVMSQIAEKGNMGIRNMDPYK
jgi:hypothetical protein